MWNSEISTEVFLLNRSRNTHDTKSVCVFPDSSEPRVILGGLFTFWHDLVVHIVLLVYILDKSWQYTFKSFFSLCSARINLKVRIRLHKRVAYVPIII